ncbi:hypothetical protein C4E24_06885 [ANME-1 cluster archaeon AG-394-G21]|nr:hypothetical protein [ANME-1 cluster archaeon AG-394-G21]
MVRRRIGHRGATKESRRSKREATEEERKRYEVWESEMSAKFLTFSDDKLFIGEMAERVKEKG